MQQIVRDELAGQHTTPVMCVTDTLQTVASDVLPQLLCLQVNLNNNSSVAASCLLHTSDETEGSLNALLVCVRL